jgi:hypothetical protein
MMTVIGGTVDRIKNERESKSAKAGERRVLRSRQKSGRTWSDANLNEAEVVAK